MTSSCLWRASIQPTWLHHYLDLYVFPTFNYGLLAFRQSLFCPPVLKTLRHAHQVKSRYGLSMQLGSWRFWGEGERPLEKFWYFVNFLGVTNALYLPSPFWNIRCNNLFRARVICHIISEFHQHPVTYANLLGSECEKFSNQLHPSTRATYGIFSDRVKYYINTSISVDHMHATIDWWRMVMMLLTQCGLISLGPIS